MTPLYVHLEVVEKSPDERAKSTGADPLAPSVEMAFDSSTLGVKWTFSKTGPWYGIWGEYGEGKRVLAYLVLFYHWVCSLIKRNTELTEKYISGQSFRIL